MQESLLRLDEVLTLLLFLLLRPFVLVDQLLVR